MKNKKGFTLIELLVVIVILSMIIIIAVPTVLTIINNSRNKVAVDTYSYNAKQKIKEKLVKEEKLDCYNMEDKYYCNQDDLKKMGLNESMYDEINAQYIIDDKRIIYENVYQKDYMISYEETSKNQKVFKVSDYGARVNDGVDDTEAFKKAAEDLSKNSGGTLLFEKGEYNIAIENEFPIVNKAVKYNYYYAHGYTYNTIINFENIANKITIDLNGATLKLASNTMPGYRIFLFNKCNDVIIKNGTIIGDRLTHDYDVHEEAGSLSQHIKSHCWGHGIVINNSNVIISNIEVSEFTGDGISVADSKPAQTSKVSIDNVEISYCRRMGLTIIEPLNVYVNDLYIHHIGDFNNITGIAPKSGIDIESETTGTPAKNINLNNLRIENITNYTIVSGKTNYTENFYIKNSTILGKSTFPNAVIDNSTFKIDLDGQTSTFNNARINNSKFYVNGHRSTIDFKNNTVVDNSIIQGKYSDTTGNYLRVNNSIIKNSDISKFQGYYLLTLSDGSTKVVRYSNLWTGILITDESSKDWENNTFDDCFITFNVVSDETKTEYSNSMKNSTIKNSTLWFNNPKLNRIVNFDKMYFDNTIMNSYSNYLKNYVHLNINNSKFNNSIFDNANQYVKNSNIILDNLDRKLHYFSSSNITEGTYDNTIIQIKNKLSSKKNFSNINFINNSKIILDNYNSSNPIVSSNVLNTDYTVEYLGSNSLD